MALIHKNVSVGPDYFKMDIISPEVVLSGRPGQFVHLKISSENSHDPLLRRPLSIHDINKSKGLISLVYRVAGRGTEIMSKLKKNTDIDLLGPLGSGFNIDLKDKKILVIGGGMGIVPLYYLTKVLAPDNDITALIGGSSKGELKYFYDKFMQLPLITEAATMDGSSGFMGTVMELWEYFSSNNSDIFDFIYSCGPEVMLRKVQKTAEEMKIPGELSLEKRMGCGIGVCLSCVCKTVNGNKRVCREGPVFPLAEVILDD